MAITSARMQMRRGLEADFDPDKMQPGEWAVSLDKKYVRMCFSVGVCVRMATYDAFEVDMAKIEEILEECQTIEEAVKLINSEVSDKLNAVIEYTNQAKQYRDEAKQFRDGAETSATNAKSSEDKAKVSETNAKVSEINAKISEENAQRVAESLPEDYTELSKAFYNTAIKQKAVGDNIHVTDSADSKIVEFGLYGKAEQKQYSGKNKFNYEEVESTWYKPNGSIVYRKLFVLKPNTSYTLSSEINVDGGAFCFIVSGNDLDFNANSSVNGALIGSPRTVQTDSNGNITVGVYLKTTTHTLETSHVQLEEGAVATPFEKFVGGIPSPNPDYPQEITVAGASGSVEVVSCEKNLLKNFAKSQTVNGVTFTIKNGIVTANGTSTSTISFSVASRVSDKFKLPVGKYILSGCPSGGSWKNYLVETTYTNQNNTSTALDYDMGDGKNIEITESMLSPYFSIGYNIVIQANVTLNNLVFKPMIRLASDTDDTYEPYTETTSTIPTPNGLCGIKVSSGGNYTDENGQQWICDEVVKYADGSGKRIQRIKKAVFDGTEDWVLSSSNNFMYLPNAMSECVVEENNKRANLLSNYSYARPQNRLANAVVDYGVAISSVGSPSIRIKECATLEDYLAYLSNTPLQIVAEITTEPIITDLTAEEIAEIEKLHTFYPITNISNDSDCGMAVTYMADAKNYIDQRLALIESAMLNNI